MVLHRCDMFFADKVILIEGAAERLILPEMVRRCARGFCTSTYRLSRSATPYAVRFRELLAFLNVKTLVASPTSTPCAPSTARPAHPARGRRSPRVRRSRTGCLQSPVIAELLATRPGRQRARTRPRRLPDPGEGFGPACARSFEDAFIIANAEPLVRGFRQLALKAAFVKEVGADRTADDIEGQGLRHRTGNSATTRRTSPSTSCSWQDWAVPSLSSAEGLQWLAWSTFEAVATELEARRSFLVEAGGRRRQGSHPGTRPAAPPDQAPRRPGGTRPADRLHHLHQRRQEKDRRTHRRRPARRRRHHPRIPVECHPAVPA
ncbi:hypothetical protein SALBM311S_10556 [Streptomyces alboniger]